jgi:hypothetical protein
MSGVMRDTQAMLAGMTPVLAEGEFVFCTTPDAARAAQAMAAALGVFREDEGVTLILERSDALVRGFAAALPMRRIVLGVTSALDGVGLTAAVSSALATHGIPCNMVAAFHHDNVFVPTGMADRAMAVLRQVQEDAEGRI